MAELATKLKAPPERVAVEDVYIHARGMRIHYQVAGPVDAPPLVLVHGIGGSATWWDKNIPAFAAHFRTYSLDLPGFGQSWRLRQRYTIKLLSDYLRDWLNLVGLERVYLLGHSLGGQIAMEFAAQHPQRIERLILAAPSGVWVTWAERKAWFTKAPRIKIPPEQMLGVAMGTMRTDLLALSWSMTTMTRDAAQVPLNLKTLEMPVLVLWGTADMVLPPLAAPRVIAMITQQSARLEYIENASHDLMVDQFEAFNRATLAFLLE
jgi:pimeloyl-ACP methyl ester carboxylesterase